MSVKGNSAKGRPRLTLPSGGNDQELTAWQTHRLVEADRLREVAQVAGGLRHLQDAIQAAPGNADAAPRFHRHPADRLQPRGVGREGRDQDPALRLLDFLKQPVVDAGFAPRRLLLEAIG